jgi:hypothetical protein
MKLFIFVLVSRTDNVNEAAENVCDLCTSYNIVNVMRSRRIGLSRYVACVGQTVKCRG